MTSWMHKPFCAGALCSGKSLSFWWEAKAVHNTRLWPQPPPERQSNQKDLFPCLTVCVCVYTCAGTSIWGCGHKCVCECICVCVCVPTKQSCNRCSWSTNPPLSWRNLQEELHSSPSGNICFSSICPRSRQNREISAAFRIDVPIHQPPQLPTQSWSP